MGLFDKKWPKSAAPFMGRVSNVKHQADPHIPTRVYGQKSRVLNLLWELRRTTDVYDAIELVTSKHPDASMAKLSFLRLANNGHSVEIYSADGSRNNEAECAWNAFAAQAGNVNTRGFDGLIDQCHEAQLLYGGFGSEVTVARRPHRISAIYPILPQWLQWEMDSSGVWHPYQQQGNKRVDLSKSNFFWVSLDPKVGTPQGQLMMESSLMAIDRQLEFFEDSHQVLRRAGYPRNVISILKESVMASMPPHMKNDPKLYKAYMEEKLNTVAAWMRSIEPTDDIVVYDEIEVNKQSGDNSRTIDLRAYNEMVDPQVINGLGTLALLLNRPTGVTETWGTVQFKILVHNLENVQRGSKRWAENIINFWLRVNGMEGYARFTHNPVDWESELQRITVQLKQQEYYRKGEEYQWIDKATAAKEAMNVTELPTEDPNGLYQYIGKSLSPPGEALNSSGQNNDQGAGQS